MTKIPLDLVGLRALYRKGALNPAEMAADVLARISQYPDAAVWIARTPEADVFARANALAARAADIDAFPLYGVPFAVKDNIDCAGLVTTAGCPAFAYTPREDSAVVARLQAAGAILFGKTNLDQFATGLVGTRSPFGAPRCVFDPNYISGGSSSGSAVAVAANLVAFSLGTDTAGSGRIPAAFNNIVGLKPTRGLISTAGVVPACRTLDCVSVFAGTATDATSVLNVAAGYDPQDPFARAGDQRALPHQGFRFGILREEDWDFLGDAESAALYAGAIKRLEASGGTAVEIDFAPFREAASLLYEGPWVAERYTVVEDLLRRAPDALDPSVHKIIAGAASRTAAAAFNAFYRLAALRRKAEGQWGRVDILLLPTAPTHPRVEDVNTDPIGLNARLGMYTNFVNLLDCCAIAVPAGFKKDGLPFGVSLIAPAFCDRDLAVLGGLLHRAAACGIGIKRDASIPEAPDFTPPQKSRVSLFVVGAHLSGMPLNRELVELDAIFERSARTSAHYRLFALAGTTPAKPGLVRDSAPVTNGNGIEGEIWSLSEEAFGRFVSRIPAPLGIGKVELEDGTRVSAFLCEAHAIIGAEEITPLGGWRAYCRLSP